MPPEKTLHSPSGRGSQTCWLGGSVLPPLVLLLLGFVYKEKGFQGGSGGYPSSSVRVMSGADADSPDFSGVYLEAFGVEGLARGTSSGSLGE